MYTAIDLPSAAAAAAAARMLLLRGCIPNGTCQNETSGGFQTDAFFGLKIMSGSKAFSMDKG